MATTQMPSATEPAELHTEIHDHRQNEQRETATDNAPRSLSEAAQNDDAGSEAHRPAPSAAVATQLYHPQATSLLKHKCLPQDNSLNIEDDGGMASTKIKITPLTLSKAVAVSMSKGPSLPSASLPNSLPSVNTSKKPHCLRLWLERVRMLLASRTCQHLTPGTWL